jgi:hypothetical protein
LKELLPFYQTGRQKGSFDDGIELALRFILASPEFVFRVEHDPEAVAPGAAYPVTDLALASRLSFFFWSTIPDDELLRVASQGRLHTPLVLQQQVKRMLSDRKSAAFVKNFTGQWLYLRNLANFSPNRDKFPEFDDNLRQAFGRETELLFDSVMREDRSVLDLLTANYTFVNERLAKHYGIQGVYGSQFRRVPVTQESRQGLLGHASILSVNSRPDRTSPVLRGKWVLENLLGTPPPPPPANVPPLKDDGAEPQKARTMREQMEEHRANPACANCHKLMDPIGLALENFDAIGSWRSLMDGVPIDVSGQLADGTKVDGPNALRQALLRQPDLYLRTLTEKLMTYAIGRGLDYHDMPVVRSIVRDAARQNYRFSAFITGIVNSGPFRMRVKAPQGEDSPASTVAH